MTRTFLFITLCAIFLLVGCAKSKTPQAISDQQPNDVTAKDEDISDIREISINRTQVEDIAMMAVQAHNDEIKLDITGVYEIRTAELYDENTILLPTTSEKNKMKIWAINITPKSGMVPSSSTELEHFHDYSLFIDAENGEIIDMIWCA